MGSPTSRSLRHRIVEESSEAGSSSSQSLRHRIVEESPSERGSPSSSRSSRRRIVEESPSETESTRPRRNLRRRANPVSYVYDSSSDVEGGDGGGNDDDDEDDPDYEQGDPFDVPQRLRAAARELQDYIEANHLDNEEVDIAGDEPGEAGAAAEILRQDISTDFNWSTDFELFSGVQEQYLRSPGPTMSSQDITEIFLAIWDEEIVHRIVQETNKYAWQVIAEFSEHDNITKNLETWYDTTVPEMYRYFAVLMFMAICPLGSLKEYWAKGVLGIPDFRAIMSRNRFQMISRFLHFVSNEDIPRGSSSYVRKISKILPIIEHCNSKFESLYTPEQELSLDESLLLWKGRLSFVQCIRTKAARFGIKTFELCEASTGYLLKCVVYAGKGSSMHQGPIHGFTAATAKVVLKVMDGYLDVGHLLVMDNYYNQVLLTRYLKSRRTDVLGTLNRQRKHVPPMIKDVTLQDLNVGEKVSCHCGDMSITTWRDVKLVTIISTFHTDEMTAGRRAGQARDKPVSVVHYNKSMGGVDLKDQKLSMYLLERKRGLKWYVKVFRRLLNTSILNAYIMYLKNPMPRVLSHRQSRLKLAESLCKIFPRDQPARVLALPPAGERRLDTTLRHFPGNTKLVPGTRKHSKRRCARCSAKVPAVRSQVTIMCTDCNVGLCIGRCWVEYHTLTELQ